MLSARQAMSRERLEEIRLGTPTGGVLLLKQMSLVLGCRHEPHLDFAEVFFGLERPCLRR